MRNGQELDSYVQKLQSMAAVSRPINLIWISIIPNINTESQLMMTTRDQDSLIRISPDLSGTTEASSRLSDVRTKVLSMETWSKKVIGPM